MAKLTDAQMATLTRGAQHAQGFISPAPKTPVPMALAAAQRLETMGLVEQVPCFHDEPFYLRDEGTGEFIGFRVTAAGFEALGIDGSEWPAYATQDTSESFDPELDSSEGGEVVEYLDAAIDPLTGAVGVAPVADMPDEPYEPNGSVEFGEPEPDASGIEGSVPAGDEAADEPLVSAADLAASMAATEKPKLSLHTAAVFFLAAWDACPAQDATDNPISRAVEALRCALPPAKAPKAAKVAGEAGEPRAGSKAALVIGLLQRPGGATAAQVEEATGWTNTSTRGFISSLKIKRGLAVETAKVAKVTHYWIGAENAPELPIETTKQAPGAKAGEQPAF